MTTNPETAGVEPVANIQCEACHGHGAYRGGWCEICQGRGSHPPAAPEDGEAGKPNLARSAVIMLAAIEAHCRNEAGLKGIDHADEGKRIRRGIQGFLATPEVAALATTRPAPEQAPETKTIRLSITQEQAHEMTRVARWERESAAAIEAESAPDHANCAVGEGMASTLPGVDSGMSGASIERAELFWANLPTHRLWASLATHEKALVCHAINRLTTPAAIRAETTAEIVAALEALENDGGPGLSGYVHNGQLLARLSDHLTGGGE